VGTGIPTVVVAAAALDDVYSISAFGISLVLGAGDGGADDALVRFGLAVAELLGGLLLGVAVGTGCHTALPPPRTKGSVSELTVAEEWGGERERGSESASHPSPVLS
jgi:hypothetical protein